MSRQGDRQHAQRLAAGPAYRDQDLVFTRRTGQPLRHEYVLHRLRRLTAEAGLPTTIRVHDLRHFAATTMLSSQTPRVGWLARSGGVGDGVVVRPDQVSLGVLVNTGAAGRSG